MSKNNSLSNKDIFDVLAISGREDSFTNLIEYLYNESPKFKNNFNYLLFGDMLVDENLSIKTRTSYTNEHGGTNIPDIIIYSRNYFCIIEVKVYAREGEKQTERYYNAHTEIEEKLGLNSCCVINKFFYITLRGIKADDGHFCSLSWSQIGKCIDENDSDVSPMTRLLMLQLKERCKSITYKPNSNLWIEATSTEKWKDETGLVDALRICFGAEYDVISSWGGFKQATNSYSISASFGKKSWIGSEFNENIDYKLEKNAKECYQFHIEFEWDSIKNVLTVRLDYHLNPYKTRNEINKNNASATVEKYKVCNCLRANVAKNLKNTDFAQKYHYNNHIGENLMILSSTTIKVENNWTVDDVKEQIMPFINDAVNFLENDLLPVLNT